MGCDVLVEIDKSDNGGTFTNHDIIRGTVRLTTTSPISLTYIQVKLEGISTTQMTIPRQSRKRDRGDKLLQDVHKVLYDTLIVFPPEKIRQVSLAKEFTLNPGTYTYPFLFKIPLKNSCVKLSGISNKILFNKKSFDVIINNGNLNENVLRNAANNFIQQHTSSQVSNHQQERQEQMYHIHLQLPPSLNTMGEVASIRYFVKVTCKRASFLKGNLRAFDPFVFLPLDLDDHSRPLFEGQQFEEYREVFFRKELVFQNRVPEIVGVQLPPSADKTKSLPMTPRKGSLLGSLFSRSRSLLSSGSRAQGSSYEISTANVPFAFEVRFRHPAYLIPDRAPSFKLFFVSEVNPSRYSLSQFGKPEESNGLGVIYLQKISVELRCTTQVSVLESDGSNSLIHQARSEETIRLCDNTYSNLQFDLFNSNRLKSSSATSSGHVNPNTYELEIPRKYYNNCVLPSKLAPSFTTCNITRKYSMVVVGGFTSTKIDSTDKNDLEKIKYVDMYCSDVQVLSGLKLTNTLHSNASGSNMSSNRKSSIPPLPQRPPTTSNSESAPFAGSGDEIPPTYDDVVRESSYQDGSEHIQARMRYQS